MLYNGKLKKYVLWTDNLLTGYQVSTSSSPTSGFVQAAKSAALDPSHGNLKPADFAIESVSKFIIYITRFNGFKMVFRRYWICRLFDFGL
jgi:hypothetical protein